ncbi:plant UBX domain-containing protein 7-like isoform X2 [Cynara cardunculus var. scolymus]|uniref:Thioredoxin-like fold n=1 Tax=Cynara cardunculus var. scolymus TaxID=59895 RepID=A0A103XCQ5_CYNCS|nr:plant UBX domain-containing protein 7-like isoform X2 [Cynara cardunculus var. scolymus]KVH88295.1 Thioredoxin-like fold [Cynara cardunculus var. scolymus]
MLLDRILNDQEEKESSSKMEGGGVLSATDQQTMVSSFLEIAVGQTVDTAKQFLQATNWKLEEAIQLFYVGNEVGAASLSPYIPPLENEAVISDQGLGVSDNHMGSNNFIENDGIDVRAPLPVKRDVLYDTSMLYGASRLGVSPHEPHTTVPFRNFEEESKRPGVWEADQGSTSTAETSRDNLASLYRPPFALMYHGSFEKAKEAANAQDRWLLVNLQSTREFSSHMLNRDTWANEAVSQTITSNFIFWQVCDDTEEGSKISTYYKLDSVPVTLVIDPITGQKMRLWRGMIQPESLLEDLLQFLDGSPKDHHFNLSHKRPRESSNTSPPKIQDETDEEDEEMKLARALSMGTMEDSDGIKEKEKHNVYPPLPEEPKGDRNLVCRVGVRLPDGRRLQRNFLRSDPIQLLWSFCAANCGDERPFRLTHAIPGAVKEMDYGSVSTFDESGLSNSMISVTWSEV